MGYGGSPTGPDSWTSDRLSSSASVFRSVVFTSPDDNHVRPARRSTHAPHRMQKNCQVVPQTAHRERYVTAYRPPSKCAAPPRPRRLSARRVGCGAWAPGRGGANEASDPYLLTSKCHFELVSVRAPGHPARSRARYRGTAAALQLPYPWPCPTQRTDRGHVVTVLHAIHATHPAPTMAPYRAAPRHCSAAAPASRSLHTPRPSMTRLIRLGCDDDATHQARLWLGSRSTINPPRMATSSVAASIGGPSGSSTRLSPRLMIERARQK